MNNDRVELTWENFGSVLSAVFAGTEPLWRAAAAAGLTIVDQTAHLSAMSIIMIPRYGVYRGAVKVAESGDACAAMRASMVATDPRKAP